MEDIYSQCERDPETGNILDPVYYTPIPEDRLIVVREGNGVWCMDALVLLKNMVLYNNVTNPLTRSPLGDDVLKQVDEYRNRQVRIVLVVNDSESVNSPHRSETLTFNSFDLVGDVIARVALEQDKSITSFTLTIEGKSLYTLDLESDLSGFAPIAVVHTEMYTLTSTEYERIKEFVGKFDRFKYKFSPFPGREPPRVQSTHSIDRIYAMINATHPTVLRFQPPTRPVSAFVQGGGLVWVPAAWGTNIGYEWSSWKLTIRGGTYLVPSDYNGGPMFSSAVHAINQYNNGSIDGNDILGAYGVDADALIRRGGALPIPIAYPSLRWTGMVSTMDVSNYVWVPVGRAPQSDGTWLRWKLASSREQYEYPPPFNGGWMTEGVINAIRNFNRTGDKGRLRDLVYGTIAEDRIERGVVLPSPVVKSLPHWIPINPLRGGLMTWDVSYSDNTLVPPGYNRQPMSPGLASDIREYNLNRNTTVLGAPYELGPIATTIVERGGDLPVVGTING